MKRVWVVEAQFRGGTWEVATFTGKEWASTSYYQAHILKRSIQSHAYRHGNKYWSKKKFRIKEYCAKALNI